ncbi:unnamed protein product [Discosporangium mesarthrocarpum]
MIRPRSERFRTDGGVNKLPQQSPALQTLGVLILWVGWYGFNAGSMGAVSRGRSSVAAHSMVTTTISAGASALTQAALAKNIHKKIDSTQINNGILAGLVAITACGPLVEPEGAFVVGVVASLVLFLGSALLLRFKIDDVVNASPVHFMCGMWGMIAASLFATKPYYTFVYSADIFQDQERQDQCCGAFYGCGAKLLGANVVVIIAICLWTGIFSCLTLFIIKHTIGLRVPLSVEVMGMDRYGMKNSIQVWSVITLWHLPVFKNICEHFTYTF